VPADIPNVVEDLDNGHPEEWVALQRSGTGDGLRVVEYERNTGCVRVSGPVVESNPPHAPAP
jgi:hypothetical protein